MASALRSLPFALLLVGCGPKLASSPTLEPPTPITPPVSVPQSDKGIRGKVIALADGDTMTVLAPDNEKVKVRLWGIDTPESKQAFGTQARKFTSDLVFGKEVEVEVKDKDRYGRTVGVVFVNGTNVNLAILQSGMGWWYRDYAKKATDYEAAQNEAKSKRIGLWKDKNPVAPWEWRKTERDRRKS